jgi:hypothetical protein
MPDLARLSIAAYRDEPQPSIGQDGTGKNVSDETIADAKAPLKIRWFSDSCIEIPVRR